MHRKRYGLSLTKKISRFDWSFLYVKINRLATMKGVTMSKFLTFEERLKIQQGLKKSTFFWKDCYPHREGQNYCCKGDKEICL